MSSVNPSAGERRAGSIGLHIPYQQMMAAVLDDAGRFVRKARADEIGAILILGPNVFCGYLDPQHNVGLWVEIDGVERLNTGDLGRQDADGYFWLTGRRKELIIRGGHNIDPKVIEEALQAHPAVAMAAAIGRPLRRRGSGRLCPGQAGRLADRTGIARIRRRPHPRTRGGPEACAARSRFASHGRRQDLQALIAGA